MKILKIILVMLALSNASLMLCSANPAAAAATPKKGYGKPLPPIPVPMLPAIGEVAPQALVPDNSTLSATTNDPSPAGRTRAVTATKEVVAPAPAANTAAAASATPNAGGAAASSPESSPRKPTPLDELLAKQKVEKRGSVRMHPEVMQALLDGKKHSPKKKMDLTKHLAQYPKLSIDSLTQLEKTYIIDYSEKDPLTGETPLMIAARNNNLPIVQHLVHEQKVALNDQDKQGNTALHHILKTIIAMKKSATAAAKPSGAAANPVSAVTEAHEAALTQKERDALARMKKAFVDLDKQRRSTAGASVSTVVEKNSAEELAQAQALALYLIKAIEKEKEGWGLTIENKAKETAMSLVMDDNQDLLIFGELIKTKPIRAKFAESMAQVHKAGDSDPDSSDDEAGNQRDRKRGGEGAAAAGSAAKPKVSIFDAARKGDLGVVTAWVETHHANLDAAEDAKKGKTVLMLAAENNHFPIVRYAIDHKAKVDEQDVEGNTALHLAFKVPKGDIEIKKALIKASSAIDKANKDKDTALHLAALSSNLELVRELVTEKYADIKTKDKRGQTARDIAKQQYETIILIGENEISDGYKAIVQFLESTAASMQNHK